MVNCRRPASFLMTLPPVMSVVLRVSVSPAPAKMMSDWPERSPPVRLSLPELDVIVRASLK